MMKGKHMENIKLRTDDIIVCDPCYIKKVSDGSDSRFDALRCGKVLHSGDDGGYVLLQNNQEKASLGVDSGRIWAMVAEFPCEIEVDSGLSGQYIIRCPQLKWAEREEFVEDTLRSLTIEENDDDWGAEAPELQYLLDKKEVAGLDKEERYELERLLSERGE